MSREAELIKEIDEHIKEAGGLYGLELSDSDLLIIRNALASQEKAKAYWVSFIIQDYEDSRPWLCALNESCGSIEEAKEAIHKQRENYRVLSAWIDVFNQDNVKTTVFHKSYINSIGILSTPKTERRQGDERKD